MSKNETSKDVSNELAETLNKRFKTFDKVAYFLGEDEFSPSDITDWISTGSSMLDIAISNRPNGGFPVGRITEIAGLEASGKSLLAAHALKSTQDKDGIAVYIDTENAISREFFQAIGVKLDDMLYIPLDTVEDIFEAVEAIIEKVRSSNKNRLVTIVIDSIMGASTKPETAALYDKDGYATSKALILSKAMRKITNYLGREKVCLIMTNQLREKLGVSFGDKYTTSGGKAIGFHSSVRIRLKSIGQIKMKKGMVEQVIGIKTSAVVIKNRMGPPLRSVEYDIYFDSGIDDYGSWLNSLKEHKLVSQAGAWYTYQYVDQETGEVEDVKFQSKDFYEKLLADPKLKQHIYDQICERMILKYKMNVDTGIDDIIIDEDFIGEDE
jgi:recombination protein RecA